MSLEITCLGFYALLSCGPTLQSSLLECIAGCRKLIQNRDENYLGVVWATILTIPFIPFEVEFFYLDHYKRLATNMVTRDALTDSLTHLEGRSG